MKINKGDIVGLAWRFLSIVFVIIVAELVSHPPSRKSLTFIPGEVSDRTILSPVDFKILKSSESLSAESIFVRDSITPVLKKTDIYRNCLSRKDSFMTFLDSCSNKYFELDSFGNFQPPYFRERVLSSLYEWLQPREITKNQLDSILWTLDSKNILDISKSLNELIDTIVSIGISEPFTQNRQKTAIIIDLDGLNQIQRPQSSILYSVDQLSDAILTYSAYRKEDTLLLRNALRKIAEVNLFFDRNWTNAKTDSALRSIDPYTDEKVSKGAEILRQNQQITIEDSIKIVSLIKFVGEEDPQIINLLGKTKHSIKEFLGRMTAVGMIFFLSFIFLSFLCLRTWKTKSKMLLFLLIVLLTSIATCVLIRYLSSSGAGSPLNFPSESFVENLIALSPVALGGLLLVLLVGPTEGVIAVLILSSVAAVYWNYSLNLFLFLFTGSAAAIAVSRKIHRRANFYTVLMAMFTSLSIISISLYMSGNFPARVLMNLLLVSFINSIISVFFALGLISLFERIFNVVTDMKLLELALDSQPLLYKMAREAQGTKYHSIIVGDIAEAAAKAIGANPVLAKVGSLYHDIGKIEHPENFIENQPMEGKNIHDSISPKESARLLRNHVDDGIVLAKKHKLPMEIIEFIQTHHGTNIMEVFLHKAEMAKTMGGPEIDENEFRYRGPLPKSKEASIVMLADSIEASCRSLKNPSEEELRDKIRSIFERRITDGQLKESEMSLREIYQIEEVFLKHMTSIYHRRVQYPSDQKNDEELNKNNHEEPKENESCQEDNT
ncbi:HDIG domain-containing protein [candidate division WOR-3 bacterium]|nr:HDIG domain-containing protein [candidate division WOR-3 bacterium]